VGFGLNFWQNFDLTMVCEKNTNFFAKVALNADKVEVADAVRSPMWGNAF
jgi:hypothetical protein